MRQERASGRGDGSYDRLGGDRLEQAARTVTRMVLEGDPELQRQMGVQRLQAELLVELGRADEALELLESTAGGSGAIFWAAGQSALALVEARCLRAVGRPA